MIERIYLGDRAITGLEVDSWNSEVRIKINLISKLPIGSDEWLFYDKENLESGYLAFSEVFYFEVSPPGMLPGDYIIDYDFYEGDDGIYFNIVSVGQPNTLYKRNDEVSIKIKCHDCWLENKNKERIK